MTVLISGGDSFTAGTELPSPEHAWPALLAERKQWNHCATAKPGNSNSAIRRTVMNAIHKYKSEDLYVAVMWSFPNRYEFRFAYDTGQRDSPWYNINPFTPPEFTQQSHKTNADQRGISDFVDSYVKNVAITSYWELYTSWSEIVFLQSYLENLDIPYTFMHVDDSLFVCDDLDQTLRTLRETIHWFATDEGMYDWAKRTNQPFYTTHPRESAHIEWINMLYDRIT